jgi:N-methylhydantoinase A
VPRDLRLEARERIDSEGKVLTALEKTEVERLVKAVKGTGATSVAITFLFSFMDPGHERMVADALMGAGLEVSMSSEVQPLFREYERTSTTVMDAYVKPSMTGYILGLEDIFKDSGILIMQSNGGVARPSIIKRAPVKTLVSGPAGGVAAAHYLGRQKGIDNIITFDMGGTSTDVSTIVDGKVRTRPGGVIDGLPINVPMTDIVTVGAGGGSLLWFDPAGQPDVGPESAGAVPGPVCYGRGGTVPTVTDCDLMLGILNPENFLGGRMALDVKAAGKAIEALAKEHDLDMDYLVRGAIDIVNSKMCAAIRVVTVERGLDPKEFALVAFGGAGPMHAALLAKELGIGKVIVPYAAGVFSALGMMVADLRMDYSRTFLSRPDDPDSQKDVDHEFEELEARAKDELGEQGIRFDTAKFERSLDMRYKGQSFDIKVPYNGNLVRAVKDFHGLHREEYAYDLRDKERAVEIVNLSFSAFHGMKKPPSPKFKGDGSMEPKGHRMLLLQQPVKASVHEWVDLRPGHNGKGPAIIEEKGFTALVPDGSTWRMDEFGNIEIEQGGGGK